LMMMPPLQQQQQQQLRPPANLAALHSSPTPSSPIMPDMELPLFPAGAAPVSCTVGWTSPQPSVPLASPPAFLTSASSAVRPKRQSGRRGLHSSQMCILHPPPQSHLLPDVMLTPLFSRLCNMCGLQWIKASRSGLSLAPSSTPQHKPVHMRSAIKAGAG
jgi:hypothetical protein